MTLRNANRPAALLLRTSLILLAALIVAVVAPAASRAQSCTPPVTSVVACENQQPGADPLDWEVTNEGDEDIQGYATSMSVNKGESISFKVKSTTPNYKIDIYRLGYYGGMGARLIQGGLVPTNTAAQPVCQSFADTGLVDCGNWNVSRTWTVPSTAVSGVYIANFVFNNHVRGSDVGISQAVFVVRDDARSSDVLYQTSDQTWQAYNEYPASINNSLYTCSICPDGNPRGYLAAYKVSYNRPLTVELDSPGSSLFNGAEYPMIRWMEQNGYDVSYFSGLDSHVRGNLIKNHNLFVSSGHDEYWSAEQRAYVKAARDAGTNLAFFSGNEMFWKTRFEPSAAGPATANRTLVSYKDTHFDAPRDPVSWTGTWRDRRFAQEHEPENALIGQSFVVNAGTSRITVPYAFRLLRMWRNTAAVNLTQNTSLPLADDTLGYEWDVDADNGFRPPGSFRLSSTTVSGVDAFIDYGSTLQSNATVTHNMTLYKAPSGARVFGAGTVQWSWGLSDWKGRTPDRNMQQATVNLFADLDAQPATRASNLVAASKTTDASAPTSTITSPPTTVNDGATVTISGTATDAGGGQVGGVEISTDNGETWRPVTSGTSSWTYSWTAHGAPSTRIRTRATDDSGNIETPGVGALVNVNCPCTIFANNTPTLADAGDTTPVEVGLKFQTTTFGAVTGVRFYKATTNTGTHIGSLWTQDGVRLAQATFSNETASGWQSVTFDQPVTIMPNTTYVVSYFAPRGHYSATGDYFWPLPAPGPNGRSISESPPLRALRTTPTSGNGVYAYGASSTFPSNMSGSANYWVDVSFTRIAAPGAVSNVTASARGLTSATVSWTAPSTGGTPTSYKITPYVGTTARTPITVTGTPPATTTTVTGLTNGTTYTFSVQAVNPNGSGPESAKSNAVTPLNAVAPSAPRDVAAQPATRSARVTWNAPEADGDSAITGYTVTPYIGATAQTPMQVGAAARTATVTNLSNGVSYTFRVTATNGAGTSVAGISSAIAPAATIFDFAAPPQAEADAGDPDPVELGLKFRADFNGTVTGVRFYKAAANEGPHVGSLWSATGSRLAQATFTNETDSGWQTVTFASPVTVTAGTTYIASYFAPNGHYAATSRGMEAGFDAPPLEALSGNSTPNGVYAYGASSLYPSQSYHSANYWVDVMYALPKPGQATNPVATAARGGASLTWTAPVAGGGPVEGWVVTPYIGATAQTPTTIEGSGTSGFVDGLTAGTSYTFTVAAANGSGAGTASGQSNAVVPTAPVAPTAPTSVQARPATTSALVSWTSPANDSGRPITGHTVTPYIGATAQTAVQVGASATSATITGLNDGADYTFRVTRTNSIGTSPQSPASNVATPRATLFDFEAPEQADSGDNSPIEVGVKFRADVAGKVTGIRFYKAAANTGTHTGSLWSSGGSRLATATFTNESASGWQTVTFAQPVDITAGTTYVASYFAPSGRYSYTGLGLQNGKDNGVLHAIASSSSPNGVYQYGSSDFPSNSYNSASYGVDVLFAATAVPGPITGLSATAGQRSATVSWTAPTSGGAPTSYRITPYIGATAQTATTITGTPPATSATITGLTAGTAYTFRVRAINGGGNGPESAGSNAVTPTSAGVPAAPTGVLVQPASSSARVSWTAGADGGSAITGYTITPYVGTTAQTAVQAGASATSATVPGLTNGTAYTFRVRANNAIGNGTDSAASASVTPRATIFDFATPATVDGGDTSGIALGVKFTSDVNGFVTGLRFYKAATNTGTHVATLYSSGGSVLGQATFSGETESGWQAVTFASPVEVVAGTTYVASYHAPNGHYSVTSAAFASAGTVNGPLRALSDAVTNNGVYAYSSVPTFPSNNFNATNYWVDVLFAPGT
jgi:hypothetical protein